jgi:hypothetical protein
MFIKINGRLFTVVVQDKLSIYNAIELLSEEQLKALAALLSSFISDAKSDAWDEMSDEEYAECLQYLEEMRRGEKVSFNSLDI